MKNNFFCLLENIKITLEILPKKIKHTWQPLGIKLGQNLATIGSRSKLAFKSLVQSLKVVNFFLGILDRTWPLSLPKSSYPEYVGTMPSNGVSLTEFI